MTTVAHEFDGSTFDLEAVFEVDDYLYFYEDFLTEERSDREVASLVKLLELDTPKRILDLPCGFGRHANRLAALGHTVTGVDVQPGFLNIARRQASEMSVQVDYRQGDMRYIDFTGTFDRVLTLFSSFGYFSDEKNLQVLQNVARALKPCGLLALDFPNRDVMLKVMQPFHVDEKNGDLMINRNSFDLVTGRLHNRRIVVRDGVRKDKPFSIRLYNATEIRDLLHQAELEVYGLYGGWDGGPLAADARRLVVIARKS